MSEKKVTKFRKDIGISLLSSIISFIISLALTPLMTRYFDPADYGVFAVVNNTGTFIATFFLFSLPNAIPIERKWSRRSQLIRTLIHIVVFAFSLTLMGTIIFLAIQYFVLGHNVESTVYIWLPFFVTSIMLLRIAQGFATAEGAFSKIAIGRVVQPLIAKSFAILASMLSTATPVYMVFFEAFGFAFQTFILVRKNIGRIKIWSHFLTLRRIKASLLTIKRYKDYSLYLNLVNLVLLASVSLQMIILVMRYTVEETGLYSLALGMTNLPVQLIALSTATIIYQQFISIASDHPDLLFNRTVKFFIGYVFLGILPYLVIFIYGESIFGIVFGEKWSQSGQIASILALPVYLQFVLFPLQSVFRVTKSLPLQFKVDFIFNILMIVFLYFLTHLYDFMTTMMIFSVLLSIYRSVSLGILFYVVWKN